MIDKETLERLKKEDDLCQQFARGTFDRKCDSAGVLDEVRGALWDLAFQAGASYGSYAVAKSVHDGWNDAAERAKISHRGF